MLDYPGNREAQSATEPACREDRMRKFIYAFFLIALLASAFLPTTPITHAAGPRWVVVNWGDTLFSIAARYGTSVDDLVRANSLPNGNFVFAGQRLLIPSGNEMTQPAVNAANGAAAGAYYTVRAGDTLAAIAARYRVSIVDVASANGLNNWNFVFSGQRLLIPGVVDVTTANNENSGNNAAPTTNVVAAKPTDTENAANAKTDALTVTEPVTNNDASVAKPTTGDNPPATSTNAVANNGTVATEAATTNEKASTANAESPINGTTDNNVIVTNFGTVASSGANVTNGDNGNNGNSNINGAAASNGTVSNNATTASNELAANKATTNSVPNPIQSVAPQNNAATTYPGGVPVAMPDPVVTPPTTGKWIDVNLTKQTITAFEGSTPVAAMLVSTGTRYHPTVVGQYHIYSKYVATLMSGGTPGVDYYYLPNVPYTMYWYQGYAIHGTYWHHNFGHQMSHGCVNLATPDAKWFFDWAPIGTLVNSHY